jgi:hypothetical protein
MGWVQAHLAEGDEQVKGLIIIFQFLEMKLGGAVACGVFAARRFAHHLNF